MKTISITAYDRPQYFVRLLETLVKNNLDGWHIVVGLEPSPQKSEQLRLIEKYIPQAEVIHNEIKLGVSGNPFSLLTYVFEELNSEINIYLEEDLIISPDVCQLAEWYNKLEDGSMCLCLCNIGKIEVDDINDNGPHSCMFYANPEMTHSASGVGFSALGLLIKSNQWKCFSDNWHNNTSGWDWSIVNYVKLERRKILMPYKTRADHIGEWGTHVGGASHNRRLMLGFLAVNQEMVSSQSYWIHQIK
tara:strand:+ start:160 stop:900 length:741 start_codon:yes stop_codon:yes gene_type:complete